jgi:hypothetical protein
MLQVSIVNPDHFAASWSRNPRINAIGLVYRLEGTRQWQTAVNNDESEVTFPFAVSAV